MVALVLLIVILAGPVSSKRLALAARKTSGTCSASARRPRVFAALAGVLVDRQRVPLRHDPPHVSRSRRSGLRVVSAKLAAGLIAGFAFGVVGEVLAFGDRRLDSLRPRHRQLARRRRRGAAAGSARPRRPRCGAGSASGLGAIVRNQVGAVIGVLAWALVVENLLFGLAPSVGEFTPERARRTRCSASSDPDLACTGCRRGGARRLGRRPRRGRHRADAAP